ncbi:MAG: hypothetical protein ACXITV_06310 [Luteibaculaceae bacterium]
MKYLLFFLTFFLSYTAQSQSSSKHFETFFMGEENIKYFIKPLDFKHKRSKINLDIAFTYGKNTLQDSTTCNYSIVTPQIQVEEKFITLQNTKNAFATKSASLLFKERSGKQVKHRVTSKLENDAVVQLFNDFNISVVHQGVVYQPTRKTRKRINRLQRDLFSLLE